MERLFSGIAACAILLLLATGVLLAIASPIIIRGLGSGFDASKRQFAQNMFYWLLPMLPMGGLSVAWRAALNSEGRFAAASLAIGTTPLLTIIALTGAGTGASIGLLAAASLAGMAMELMVLGFALMKCNFPLIPRWYGLDDDLRHAGMQYLPLIAATAIASGNVLIDQSMAAMLAPGSVSALNYGTRLAAVLAGIAGTATGTAALPHFSRMIASKDWQGIAKTMRVNRLLVLAAGIPLALALAAYSTPLVRVLFQRGAFGAEAAELVAAVQRYSVLQIPVAVLLAMQLRLVSALNANSLLLGVAAINLVVNLVGDLVFMKLWGVPGIAVSNVLVQIVSLVVVTTLVRKRVNAQMDRTMSRDVAHPIDPGIEL